MDSKNSIVNIVHCESVMAFACNKSNSHITMLYDWLNLNENYWHFYNDNSVCTTTIQRGVNLSVEGSTSYKQRMNWSLSTTLITVGTLVYLKHRRCWNQKLSCIWKKMVLTTHSSTESQVMQMHAFVESILCVMHQVKLLKIFDLQTYFKQC